MYSYFVFTADDVKGVRSVAQWMFSLGPRLDMFFHCGASFSFCLKKKILCPHITKLFCCPKATIGSVLERVHPDEVTWQPLSFLLGIIRQCGK